MAINKFLLKSAHLYLSLWSDVHIQYHFLRNALNRLLRFWIELLEHNWLQFFQLKMDPRKNSNEDFSNNLVISNGKYAIHVPDPWHCGQFQEGNSSIHLSTDGGHSKEIKCIDDTGLFTREIEHAAQCILESQIESKFICHAETQSNMFWLDKWRQEMKIDCPMALIINSPIFQSKAYLLQESQLERDDLPGLSKPGSRLALGRRISGSIKCLISSIIFSLLCGINLCIL